MSSPVTAWEGCSRLSPYLAWGCISLREVFQRTKAAADALRAAKAGTKGGSGKGSRGAGAQGGKGGQAAKKRQRRGGRQQADEAGGGSEGEEEEEAGDPAAGEAAAAEAPAAEGAPGSSGPAVGLKDLAAFTARLRWRSHFMQVCFPGWLAPGGCLRVHGSRRSTRQAWCTAGASRTVPTRLPPALVAWPLLWCRSWRTSRRW